MYLDSDKESKDSGPGLSEKLLESRTVIISGGVDGDVCDGGTELHEAARLLCVLARHQPELSERAPYLDLIGGEPAESDDFEAPAEVLVGVLQCVGRGFRCTTFAQSSAMPVITARA